jgi:hypothetical protein
MFFTCANDFATEHPPSRQNRFGLGRNWLLLRIGCRALCTVATEAARELAAVICVDVGVVLRPGN